MFGDGRQLRDLSYVDDVVDAFLLAALSDAGNGEVFNLGGDGPVGLAEVAALLVRLAGQGGVALVPFPPEHKAIDIGDYYADDRKIRSTLGWRPTTALGEGLTRTLAYYREHRRHYWEHD